jgi:hypothetical protein
MTLKRKLAHFTLGCALVVVLGLVYWFGILANWWSPLVRPHGVPPGAKHVFIWESAAWFDCSVDSKRDVDVCRAWDAWGRLVASGDFRLEGENRAATPGELRPSTPGRTNRSGLSGEIYLFGPNGLIEGKKLIRVGPTARPAH